MTEPFSGELPMALVRLRRAAQITLPQDIREAAHLKEGDYLEAEVTETGTILLKPVNISRREPTPEEEAEILSVVDQERKGYAAERRR
jgi:AbrB family looped-hinge helix DNA binding protein